MTLSKLKEIAADCIVGLHGGQAIWVGLQFSGVLGSYKTREIICIASSEEPFLQFGLVYSPFHEVSAGTICSAH